MNSSTYIFGELSDGYSQYPEDSSSNLFKSLQDQRTAPSQLIIHRDENMIYYIYVRNLDKGKYIGFAIAINGYYFTQIQPLFSIFENQVEELVENGVIISFTNNGKITSHLTSFAKEEEEVLEVINSLQIKVNNLNNLKKLPPVDFSVAVASRKLLKDTDSESVIANASCRFGYTIVLKESDYDTIRATSFKSILQRINAENSTLIKENDELKKCNRKIQQQKKQFKNVVILVAILIACGIGLFFLNVNLNDTQDRLDTANNTISEKESLIAKKNSTISNLRNSVNSLEYNLNKEVKAKEKMESTLQTIFSYSPFAVTSCEVNSNQFKFDYFSLEEKEIDVILKAINERNSEIITSSYTLTFYKGTGSKSLDFYRSLDNSQYYYVFLLHDGHIIAGKRW